MKKKQNKTCKTVVKRKDLAHGHSKMIKAWL